MTNPTSENIQLTTTIPEDLAGLRLDQAIAKLLPQYSRARLQTWIREAAVRVNGKLLPAKAKVTGGEKIELNAIVEAIVAVAEDIFINIVYEDESILIIDKPAGLVVHPGAGNREGTLLNALLHHLPALQCIPRAGIVHRLDKDTTGLLVIAKTLQAHTHLVQQLQTRSMGREYVAVVQGLVRVGGTVNAAVGRHTLRRQRMAVTAGGKPAITHYKVLERFLAHSYLDLKLDSGRTHQIRVHMAHIGHPVVGDPIYAGRLALPQGMNPETANYLRHFKRQALHAKCLTLQHPITGLVMQWQSPLPADMQELLEFLQRDHLKPSSDKGFVSY
ncbi:23S rRNA pseudouridine(1911/1915/1917) synthase RluD [soil metagenome]